MTSTFLAIRSSTSFTCWAGSTLAGPTIETSRPNCLPPRSSPLLTRLNQGMPVIFTTVTMVFSAAALAGPIAEKLIAPTAVAPSSLNVSRLFTA